MRMGVLFALVLSRGREPKNKEGGGYLPPQSKHDFSLATAENGGSPAVAASGATQQCEPARFGSETARL